MVPGSQILCLNELILGATWLYKPKRTPIMTSGNDASWNANPLDIFHYTVPTNKSWTCSSCQYSNLMGEVVCDMCGTACRAARSKVSREVVSR